jgi:hypothetical protein
LFILKVFSFRLACVEAGWILSGKGVELYDICRTKSHLTRAALQACNQYLGHKKTRTFLLGFP